MSIGWATDKTALAISTFAGAAAGGAVQGWRELRRRKVDPSATALNLARIGSGIAVGGLTGVAVGIGAQVRLDDRQSLAQWLRADVLHVRPARSSPAPASPPPADNEDPTRGGGRIRTDVQTTGRDGARRRIEKGRSRTTAPAQDGTKPGADPGRAATQHAERTERAPSPAPSVSRVALLEQRLSERAQSLIPRGTWSDEADVVYSKRNLTGRRYWLSELRPLLLDTKKAVRRLLLGRTVYLVPGCPDSLSTLGNFSKRPLGGDRVIRIDAPVGVTAKDLGVDLRSGGQSLFRRLFEG